MARDRLDTEALYAALDAQRAARKLSWRQLAKEVGVSPSTMTRIANGQRPDVDAFAALVRWLGQSADMFLVGDDEAPREEPDLVAQLAPLLRARRDLKEEDAKYLEDLISVAVRRFKAESAELSMKRGFKTEARKLALELRDELGLDAYGKFDPYALAAEYGILSSGSAISARTRKPVRRQRTTPRTVRSPSPPRSSRQAAGASS